MQKTADSAIKEFKIKIKNLKSLLLSKIKKVFLMHEIDYKLPMAFVVGNETDGMFKRVVKNV